MKKNIQLFWLYFKIAIFTVGGGLVMLPLIERELVVKRGWVEKDEILDIFAVSQSLPGVIAANVAIHTGFKVNGVFGSIFAILGIALPSLVVILTVAAVFHQFADNVHVQNALRGVTVGLAAMLISIAVRLGKRAIKTWIGVILAVLALVASAVFNVNAIYIVVAGVIFGLAASMVRRK